MAPGLLEAGVNFCTHWREELTMTNIAYESVKASLKPERLRRAPLPCLHGPCEAVREG